MDQISRIRFKNLLERILTFCNNAEGEKEKAILLRIGVVTLNKLRIHVDNGSMLGEDVRNLNVQVTACTGRSQLVELMWDETVNLLDSYRETFV